MVNTAREPIVIAHRGLHSEHPENSLGAFRAAWHADFTWCECDVWDTAAGETVVLHDETLERTTTGRGSVRELKFDDYRHALRLKMPDRRVTEEPLPALADVNRARPHDKRLLVEIKPANALVLVEDLVGPDCAIQSFDLANVEHAASHRDAGPVIWLIEKESQLDEAARCPAKAIYADFNLLNAESVAFLRRMKKQIGAWTVNQEVDIVRMLALGVEVIISDDPLLARRIVRSHGPRQPA